MVIGKDKGGCGVIWDLIVGVAKLTKVKRPVICIHDLKYILQRLAFVKVNDVATRWGHWIGLMEPG